MPRPKPPAPADDARSWRWARRRSRRTRCACAVEIPVRYPAVQRPAAPRPTRIACVPPPTAAPPPTASGIRPARRARRSRSRPQRQHQVHAPERQRRGRMVEEGDSRGHSRSKVAAMRRQADRADQQRNRKGARRRLVLESQYGRTGNQRAQRADRRHQQRGREGRAPALRPSAVVPICRARAWRSAGRRALRGSRRPSRRAAPEPFRRRA